MNYLTESEIYFLNTLKEEHDIRGDKSFFSILFLGYFFENDIDFNIRLNNSLMDYKKSKGYEILKHTQWLFESQESCFVGKYKKHFIGTASEGEYFSMGFEVQNIPTYLITAEFGDISDSEEKELVIESFADKGINFELYLNEYRNFCEKAGLSFQQNYAKIYQQAKEFELIKNNG